MSARLMTAFFKKTFQIQLLQFNAIGAKPHLMLSTDVKEYSHSQKGRQAISTVNSPLGNLAEL